jgi:hypothetical protein
LLSAVVSFVVLLAFAALLGFLADRYGDRAEVVDMSWHLADQQRRHDRGERAGEVAPGSTRGAVLAAVGGTVATLACLMVPFVPLPVAGAVTMPAAVAFLADYAGWVNVLWLLPLGTAVIAFNGFRLWIGTDRGPRWCRWTSAGLAATCAVVIVPLLAVLFLPALATSLILVGTDMRAGSLQVGYYLCVLGVAASLVGSQVVAGRLRAASPS